MDLLREENRDDQQNHHDSKIQGTIPLGLEMLMQNVSIFDTTFEGMKEDMRRYTNLAIQNYVYKRNASNSSDIKTS